MRISRIVLFICLATLLSACGGNAPAKAAETWFQAVATADGVTAFKLTCETHKADVQNMGFLMGGLNLFTGGMASDAEADTSDLDFKTTAKKGSEAAVRVNGIYIQGLMGAAMEQEIDTPFVMVKEDGEWKWCGEK